MNNKQSYMTKVAWPEILSNHSEPLCTAENLFLLFVGRNSRGWFTSCWKRNRTPMFDMVWHEENRSKNAQTAKSCVKTVACQRAVPDYAVHISLFTTHFTQMEKIKDCLGQPNVPQRCDTTLHRSESESRMLEQGRTNRKATNMGEMRSLPVNACGNKCEIVTESTVWTHPLPFSPGRWIIWPLQMSTTNFSTPNCTSHWQTALKRRFKSREENK